jgi:hypothetical protein
MNFAGLTAVSRKRQIKKKNREKGQKCHLLAIAK